MGFYGVKLLFIAYLFLLEIRVEKLTKCSHSGILTSKVNRHRQSDLLLT